MMRLVETVDDYNWYGQQLEKSTFEKLASKLRTYLYMLGYRYQIENLQLALISLKSL